MWSNYFRFTDDEKAESLPRKPAKNATIRNGGGDGKDAADGQSDEDSDEELDEENEDPDDPYNLAGYDDEDDNG